MLTIRLDSPVPLTDQLVAGLRGAIARRQLRIGDPLPTVRQLAADLGVNMNTVARAYRTLEADGLVSSKRGRGTVVASDRTPGTDPERAELRRRMGEVLCDVRLAGVDRGEVLDLVERELENLWPEE